MNKKIQRHTWGLRDALIDEMDALRMDKITPERARAMASLGAVVLKSVEVELQVVNHWNRAKEGDTQAISREIRLGAA
jgi:hypothetical protein